MKAIGQVKANIGKASKGSENPFFKSKYASLESVYEAIGTSIEDAGLCVLQAPDTLEGNPVLTTRITHIESGETVISNMPLLLTKQDSQGLGSAITYARRYSICAIFGILQEDDDGNKASTAKPVVVSNKDKKVKVIVNYGLNNPGAIPKIKKELKIEGSVNSIKETDLDLIITEINEGGK